MPKSKRNKIVHLTQVKKKGKDHKEDLIKQLEENVAKFERVFVFDFDSVKSDRIMSLRVKLKEHGRIFAGRNSLATVTLRTIGTRTRTDFGELVEQIVGHRGLLFTDLQRDKLVELLDKENQKEFLKRLKGFAQIAPDTTAMDLDSEGGDAKKSAPATKTAKRKQKKLRKQKATDEDVAKQAMDDDEENDDDASQRAKRQVKFVKI